MHIKKILTFLASAIIKWLPVGAEDIRFIGDDNLIYRIDTETVHAEILGVKTGVKLTGEVRIPEKVTYEGVDYTVDAVGRFDTFWTSEPDYDDKPCFYQQDEITSVYIPKTVKDIGYRTFAGCKSLKSFSVSPSSPYFRSDGGNLFIRCKNGDKQLLRYPPGTGATSWTMPESCEEICEGAFADNTTLESITFTGRFVWIKPGAFYGATALKTFKAHSSAGDESMYVKDGILYHYPAIVAAVPPALTNGVIIVPEGVTTIYSGAFYGNKAQYVRFPSSLENIGDWAFTASAIVDLIVPANVTEIGHYAFSNCKSLKKADIRANITQGCGFFENCSSLTECTLPPTLTYMERHFFRNCSSLSTLCLPSTVTRMETSGGQFSGTAITKVVWPEHLDEIPQSCFEDCASLTSITLPSTLRKINDFAFSAAAIETINTGGASEIGYRAFADCPNLRKVAIPANNDTVKLGRIAFELVNNGSLFINAKDIVCYEPDSSLDDAFYTYGSMDLQLYTTIQTCRHGFVSYWRTLYYVPGAEEIARRGKPNSKSELMYTLSADKKANSVTVTVSPRFWWVKPKAVRVDNVEATASSDGLKWTAKVKTGDKYTVEVDFTARDVKMNATHQFPMPEAGVDDIEIDSAGPDIEISQGEIRITGTGDSPRWQIYNASGIVTARGEGTTISTGNMTPGIYMIAIDDTHHSIVKKIRI